MNQYNLQSWDNESDQSVHDWEWESGNLRVTINHFPTSDRLEIKLRGFQTGNDVEDKDLSVQIQLNEPLENADNPDKVVRRQTQDAVDYLVNNYDLGSFSRDS